MSTTSSTLILHDDPQTILTSNPYKGVYKRWNDAYQTGPNCRYTPENSRVATPVSQKLLPLGYHRTLSNCHPSLQQSKIIGMDVPNKKMINLYLFLLKSEILTAKFSPPPSLYGYFTKTSRTKTESHCTEASN